MFESTGSGSAGSGPSAQTRAAAVARLARVLPRPRLRPVEPVEGPFERAVRVAPGVYLPPGRRPVGRHVRPSAEDGDRLSGTNDPAAAGAPGPGLAAALDEAAPDGLSSYELVEAVAGWERLASWAAAKQAEMIAEFARRRPGPYAPDEPGRSVSEFAADEIAARLSITRRAAETKLGLAVELADRLPGTWAALAAGRIDVPKARAVAEHTSVLDPAGCAAVEVRVLPRASSQTTSGLRRSLARAVHRVDPRAAARRRQAAARGRYVRLHPQPDGMAELSAMLPAEDAVAVFTSIDGYARYADPADPRSLDARRADTLVDLCTGTVTIGNRDSGDPKDHHDASGDHPAAAGDDDTVSADDEAGQDDLQDDAAVAAGGDRGMRGTSRRADRWDRRGGTGRRHRDRDRRGRRDRRNRRRRRTGRGRDGQDVLVQVTVAASTLLGLDEAPAELAGYGPIPAEVARAIAADPHGTWRRILTDPVSGVLLDYGTTVYRPPPGLARHVIARDQVCQFPGCRQPAIRCDLDHGVPHPHGPTCPGNLIPLCRHHHRAKTEGGWQWRRLPDGGIVWTAPTGHTYPVGPPALFDDWHDWPDRLDLPDHVPANPATTGDTDDCPF